MVQFNYPPAPESVVEKPERNNSKISVAPEPLPAGRRRRVLSYALDVALTVAIFLAIVWVSFAVNGYRIDEILLQGGPRGGVQMLWPLALLFLVVHLGYFLVQEATWRCTVGKAVFGLRIRSSSGFAVLGRAFCFFVAAIPMGVGLLWSLFDSRRRCWHDVITDSEVVLT